LAVLKRYRNIRGARAEWLLWEESEIIRIRIERERKRYERGRMAPMQLTSGNSDKETLLTTNILGDFGNNKKRPGHRVQRSMNGSSRERKSMQYPLLTNYPLEINGK
jgi:hypothetical protein